MYEILTVKDIAQRLGYNPVTVRTYLCRKEFNDRLYKHQLCKPFYYKYDKIMEERLKQLIRKSYRRKSNDQ